MSNLDPITQLKTEFDVKLQTMAAEFSDTLQEIGISLTGITKTVSMALDVLRSEVSELKGEVDRLNLHIQEIHAERKDREGKEL